MMIMGMPGVRAQIICLSWSEVDPKLADFDGQTCGRWRTNGERCPVGPTSQVDQNVRSTGGAPPRARWVPTLKTGSYVTMSVGFTASKSMASRIGVSRATRPIPLRYLYIQDLVSAGVARLQKVPTKRERCGPTHQFRPMDSVRYFCELQHLRSAVGHYRIHAITSHQYFLQMSRHDSKRPRVGTSAHFPALACVTTSPTKAARHLPAGRASHAHTHGPLNFDGVAFHAPCNAFGATRP